MPRALKLTSLLLVLVLGACSARQPIEAEPPRLVLLPPAEISQELLLKQKISFEAGGARQQFLVVARFERARLKLVLLLPSGQTVLTLDYDGNRLQQDNQSTVELPGKEILASMQYALWPETSLLRHYRKADGWLIEVNGEDRALLTPSGSVLKIGRTGEALILDNQLHDYRVIIQTLEKREL